MLHKFMTETNARLVDVWNEEDGLTEATNIATQTVKNIVKDMRKAIDDKDSKKEMQLRKQAEKAMIEVSKPMVREFQLNLQKFIADQKKTLSNKYGMTVDVYSEGKPVLGIGTNSSPLATKAGFSFHFIVDQPDV